MLWSPNHSLFTSQYIHYPAAVCTASSSLYGYLHLSPEHHLRLTGTPHSEMSGRFQSPLPQGNKQLIALIVRVKGGMKFHPLCLKIHSSKEETSETTSSLSSLLLPVLWFPPSLQVFLKSKPSVKHGLLNLCLGLCF